MSTNNDGTFVGLIWVLTFIFTILSGILAWNWIEPHTFFGVIGFLVIWGVLSKVGHLLAIGITALFSRM